ncbi:MAG: hypothetical protein K0S98_2700, partial [Propionibacteriaceae bacterium]|nr:hypothetical protein [Propionibacteriaceae bacterium]
MQPPSRVDAVRNGRVRLLQALSLGVIAQRFSSRPAMSPSKDGPFVTDHVLLAHDPKLDADWWRQAVVYQVYP